TSLAVNRGFFKAEQSAEEVSGQTLESFSKNSLLAVTEKQAQLYSVRLQDAAGLTVLAADYLENLHSAGAPSSLLDPANTVVEFSQLTASSSGLFYFDDNPGRRTEVIHVANFPPDEATDRSLRDSSALDLLFPTLLRKIDSGVAIYYQSPQFTLRYFPVINLPEIVLKNGAIEAALAADPADLPAGPAKDPDRKTIWLPPYLDSAGQGVVASVQTPIYYGDEFSGYIGLDVALSKIIQQLNSLKPTENSFVFLLDQEGKLIAISPQDAQKIDSRGLTPPEGSLDSTLGLNLADLNPDLAQVLTPVNPGQPETYDAVLSGQPVFITSAPLPDLDWRLSIVVPLAEVTNQAQSVTRSIRED
ncbi:MAG: cache domain-containing protein, partial [Anaerolineales bacterium]